MVETLWVHLDLVDLEVVVAVVDGRGVAAAAYIHTSGASVSKAQSVEMDGNRSCISEATPEDSSTAVGTSM